MPERGGQVFHDRPDARQEASLSGVHAELLEVDADEGTERPEGSEEEEVEHLGHEQPLRRRVREESGEKVGHRTRLGLWVFVLEEVESL